MAGSAQPYPNLTAERIRSLQYVFLTHSHADHTGALPWLLEQGFAGTIIASDETFGQLPFSLPDTRPLRSFRPPEGLTLYWGRSGHCPGSVWYEFGLEGQTLLFSGDYTERSLVYETDPIRRTRAELAVIDCAYGADPRSAEVLRFDFLTRPESRFCCRFRNTEEDWSSLLCCAGQDPKRRFSVTRSFYTSLPGRRPIVFGSRRTHATVSRGCRCSR